MVPGVADTVDRITWPCPRFTGTESGWRASTGQGRTSERDWGIGWSGVALALVAAVVAARRSGGGWRAALLVLAVLALAFAGFVTYTVYGDAPTTRFMCFG
jgi:hypothetical protein